jgi:sulfur-oxidizing protein SoxX
MAMNKKTVIGLAAMAGAAGLIGCATSLGDTKAGAEAVKRTAEVMRASFASKGIASIDRLNQDDVQRLCTEYADKKLPPDVAEKIQQAQLASIKKPASGKLIGDWKAGEKIAQEGRGARDFVWQPRPIALPLRQAARAKRCGSRVHL